MGAGKNHNAMKKTALEIHLEGVTPHELRKCKHETITMFASACGVNGLVRLLFDGVGAYIVQHQTQNVLRTFVAQHAIDKYTNLLTEKINDNENNRH